MVIGLLNVHRRQIISILLWGVEPTRIDQIKFHSHFKNYGHGKTN